MQTATSSIFAHADTLQRMIKKTFYLVSVDLLNLKQNFESQFEVTVMIECFLSAENQCSVNYAGNFNFDESGPNQIFGQ